MSPNKGTWWYEAMICNFAKCHVTVTNWMKNSNLSSNYRWTKYTLNMDSSIFRMTIWIHSYHELWLASIRIVVLQILNSLNEKSNTAHIMLCIYFVVCINLLINFHQTSRLIKYFISELWKKKSQILWYCDF